MPGPVPELPPPPVAPEDVQLETPPARTASNKASSNALRRRTNARGKSTNPQTNGTAPQPVTRAEVCDCQVAIMTVALPLAVAGTLVLAEGLNEHVA